MSRRRYAAIDAIRGIALINMIAYHAAWDLVYLFHIDWPWYHSAGAQIWQQIICSTFIFLSGFCQPLSKRPIKRGVSVLLAGSLITAVTLAFLPEDRVVFGVLTLLGSCMLIGALTDPVLKRCHPLAGISVSIFLFLLTKHIGDGYLGYSRAVLWHLPADWDRNLFTTYLGIPMHGFYSTDYFGLIPWLFLFIAGYFLCRLWKRWELLPHLEPSRLKPVEWIGKHSIRIYLLHQPVLYALLLLLFL